MLTRSSDQFCRLLRCLYAIAILSTATPLWGEGKTSASDYPALKEQVTVQLDKLRGQISKAEAMGIDTSYTKVSVETIRAFQQAADWDHANIEEVRTIYKTFKYYDQTDPTRPDQLAFNELGACLKVADYAMAELQQQMDGGLIFQPTPDFSQGKIELTPGTYRLDGQRVFPYTLFWLPTMNEGMGDAFGRMGHSYLAVSYLNKQGEINPRVVKTRTAEARKQSADNFTPLKFFWAHVAAPWMTDEQKLGGRRFTQYDTDSPENRRLMVRLCEQFIPPMTEAYGDKPMVYMIANEPHFGTAERSWLVRNGISENTNNRYRSWLEEKYNAIDQLNALYGTSHADFASVPSPFPIKKALRGSPVWYDWCRFNMDRINDWFTFLKTTIQSQDGGRKEPVTIKVLGHHFSDSSRNQGIDIEYLTGLQDVTGGDLRVRPFDATVYTELEGGLKADYSWTERYAYGWISQALFLDFAKSLAPEKVFYDTEWHGFGAVHWRRFDLPRNYVRAGIWHAFTHGMGAIEPWMWGRHPDGSLRKSADQIGELATQPVALDAYGRVMKELNAHAEIVAAAVPEKRTFMFYYLEESAIQDENYSHHLESSYESVKLLNHPMGLTTPTHLATLDHKDQIVVVPPSQFISDKSLQALQKFQQAGGRIVLTEPEACFTKNELGLARKSHGIKPVATVSLGDVLSMTKHFEKALAPFAPKTPVSVSFTDASGKKAYGVLLQHATLPESGTHHLVMNNSSRQARTVTIDADSNKGTLTDVLTGETLQSPFTLNSCDVRVIRVGLSE